MKVTRFAAALVGALTVAGCSKDGGPFYAPVLPLAYTRFVSAVPDTSAMDWRFIDGVANSPFAFAQNFRGFTPYAATTPGARHLRIFPSSTNLAITSQIVQDQTLTFEAGKYYTIVHVGLARVADSDPNADKIVVYEDAFPTPPASSIALRVINLGPGLNTGAPTSVDVFATATTADPTPAAALVSGLAFLSASPYATRATGGLALRAFAAGTTTSALANVLAQPGVAANPALSGSAVGGSTMAGTAMTAFIFGRTTTGSAAPQSGNCPATPASACASPTVLYLVDRRPL